MSFSLESVINIKTGSTAKFSMQLTETTLDGNGDPVESPMSLEDYSIYLDFINPKTRLELFTAYFLSGTSLPTDPDAPISNGITITSVSGGKYEVDAGDTLGWPLGKIEVDILYSKDGDYQHTESFFLNMVQGHSQR